MGSPLSPLFAIYHMAYVRSKFLNLFNPTPAPILYLRYIDDILLVVPKIQTLHSLKRKFEENSVIKFTFDVEAMKKLPFLDYIVT